MTIKGQKKLNALIALSSDPWVLLAGGDTVPKVVDTVELVSLDEANFPVPACLRTLAKYPWIANLMYGAVIGGRGS